MPHWDDPGRIAEKTAPVKGEPLQLHVEASPLHVPPRAPVSLTVIVHQGPHIFHQLLHHSPGGTTHPAVCLHMLHDEELTTLNNRKQTVNSYFGDKI